MAKISINVNGSDEIVNVSEDTPLLYVLRNQLELNGPKFGCGISQCGACMVLMDDRAVTSCAVPLGSVGDARITTLEGLKVDDQLHPVQQAFIDEQAMQCGYCVNGIIMSAVSLLKKNSEPSDAEIRSALQGNLCRCSAHTRMLKAMRRVRGAEV